jgi:3-hydroxyacyl-CoA dehydrogenase
VEVIRANYGASARKGRLTPEQIDRAMALLTPTLDFDALATVDLVIEAAFESMSVKKDIFTRLDTVAKPDAILASNTSFLDLDEIAQATSRPGQVIGLHFFSPANVMPLLEVVRGEETEIDVIATGMQLARKIGKKPVISRVCHGFIANRLMDPRLRQAEALTLEGPTPAEIDRVIREYGFAMGPFQMIDLVGLDVIDRDTDRRSLRSDLVALGRLGQKQNGGFYDYDTNRKASPSPVAQHVIEAFASDHGMVGRGPQTDEQILARLLYPVVNEGARILEEGIALRASDIDQTAILGYGWPVYTGGPMFWAGTIGLDRVVAGLRDLQARYGDAFRPAQLLEDLAARGQRFA